MRLCKRATKGKLRVLRPFSVVPLCKKHSWVFAGGMAKQRRFVSWGGDASMIFL